MYQQNITLCVYYGGHLFQEFEILWKQKKPIFHIRGFLFLGTNSRDIVLLFTIKMQLI